jgi:hypothetical protein
MDTLQKIKIPNVLKLPVESCASVGFGTSFGSAGGNFCPSFLCGQREERSFFADITALA